MGRLTDAMKALAGKDAGNNAVQVPCTCGVESKKMNKHMTVTRITEPDKHCPKHGQGGGTKDRWDGQ